MLMVSRYLSLALHKLELRIQIQIQTQIDGVYFIPPATLFPVVMEDT